MSYVFTNDDYDQLSGVCSQLGFMAALLSTAKTVQCDSGALESTLYALQEPISKVLKTLDDRSDIDSELDSMKNHEWAQIINLVSGRASMSVRDIVKIDEKLANAVAADPDKKVIFDVWRAVVTTDGKFPMMTETNNMVGFHIQFERPKRPELPPATEQSVLDMYGAKNAKDMLNRIVAMSNGADPAQLWDETRKAKRKARKREPVAAE